MRMKKTPLAELSAAWCSRKNTLTAKNLTDKSLQLSLQRSASSVYGELQHYHSNCFNVMLTTETHFASCNKKILFGFSVWRMRLTSWNRIKIKAFLTAADLFTSSNFLTNALAACKIYSIPSCHTVRIKAAVCANEPPILALGAQP